MGGVNEPNSVVQLRLSLTMVDQRNLKICRTESGRFKLRQNALPREVQCIQMPAEATSSKMYWCEDSRTQFKMRKDIQLTPFRANQIVTSRQKAFYEKTTSKANLQKVPWSFWIRRERVYS